jgi:catechol 2,3-dioxygenase-like lactoylglutathione lyase family enzyme
MVSLQTFVEMINDDEKVSHVGIALRDINAAVEFLKEKFGSEATDRGIGRGFHVAFLPTEGSPIELIQDVFPEGKKEVEK